MRQNETHATRPGIVAYPQPQPSTSPALTATPAPAGASADKIVEGATVHERQALMTILADGKLAVNVKVHKASVNRIQRGQTARIVLNGFPNRGYSGRVQKVLVVPDTLNAGRMPDPKDFNVIVSIDNPPADLKPGMSARVEILIAKLTDVLAAPVQAVATVNGRQVCYVAGKGGAEPRVVKTGLSNADYVEITGGLEPGEKVLLRAPTAVGPAPAVSAAAAVTALADDGEAKRPKPASLEAQADAEGPKAAVAPKNPTP